MPGLSLVAASGATLHCRVWGIHIALTFLVAEHVLLGMQASIVVAQGLSCIVACGIFPDQESNPCPL